MDLDTADRSALTQNAKAEVGSTVIPCDAALQRSARICVRVVGEDRRGLADVALRLSRSAVEGLRLRTDPEGDCAFEGLAAGSYPLCALELDEDAWELVETQPLQGDEVVSSGEVSWQPEPAPAPNADVRHTIVQGECVGKVAERYGLLIDAIWAHAANAELKKVRDSPYILAPGDLLLVPARRLKEITATTGTSLILRRKGVPERLHIRFLDIDDSPRAGLPYLLAIQTDDGDAVPDIAGKTDQGGFVDASIPPSATIAEIVLFQDGEREVHQFKLGCVNPIDSISGWQSRLNNLGYDCGAEDGYLGEYTAAAITRFQRSRKLPESGRMDAATESALRRLALS